MKEIILAYLEAYNDRNVPAMLALLDDKLVFENVSNSSGTIKTTSKHDFEQLALQSVNYFTERRQIVRFLVLNGNSAAVEIDYQATLAQDSPTGLKAGDQLKLRGASFFEANDGKLTRISDYS